jgi:hypothetical protein
MLEFPLVVTLALGLVTFSQIFVNNEDLKIVSIIGGSARIVFAFTQIISVLKGKDDKQNPYAGINHKKGDVSKLADRVKI